MINPQDKNNSNKLPQDFDKSLDNSLNFYGSDKYVYNDCANDGYCSLDPIMYSLMEVLLYELKQLTYYYIKMQDLGYENKKLKNCIINYFSLIIVGYEFNRKEFENLLEKVNKEKESVKKTYINICDKENIDCQILKSGIDFNKFDIMSIINQGEKQAIIRNKTLKSEIKNLYEIILNIIRSASIRLIELKSYTEDYLPEEDGILKLFNNLNFSTYTESKLIKKINDFSKINYEIHKKIHKYKEDYYGKISLNKVEIGVKTGNSILISGQNLKDLEEILEATKDKDINVYTHNGLIVAHAYPKFVKYKNLKGHFQMSLDSVQFDFASFKGPVVIVRNFQYLLEGLYRGRLFTTNLLGGRGIKKIENNDFSPIIKASLESSGFESNHRISEVNVGYNEKYVMEKINVVIDKIKNKEIKQLIFIGLLNHASIHSQYFKELEQNLPKDCFVISTLIPSIKENVLYFDSFFNTSLVYKIISHLKKEINISEFPITMFITNCNLHTITHLFNLKYLGVKDIFLPSCTSNVITPNMLKFLKDKFGFKQVTENIKEDIRHII